MNFKIWLENTELALRAEKLRDMAAQAKISLGNIGDPQNINQLIDGMETEREHDGKEGSDIDVVKGELDLLKIAMAHLREDPHYYTKLKKAHL